MILPVRFGITTSPARITPSHAIGRADRVPKPACSFPICGVPGGWREGNHDKDDAPVEAWERERVHVTKRGA